MTTVAAIARDGVVVMAADSCNNVYDRPIVAGATKILRFPANDGQEQVLLGFCGDGAIPRLAVRHLTVAAVPDIGADHQEWADCVASAITEIALQNGCTDDGKLAAPLLLGAHGQVWTLTHHQAIPHVDGVAAIGSGEGPAIGAIDLGLALGVGLTLEALAESAVVLAIARDRYSRSPVQVERLD